LSAPEENTVKLLEANEVTKIVSEREFREHFREPLFLEILLPAVAHSPNGMRPDELEEMAAELENWLYAMGRYFVLCENEIKMFGKAPKIIRPHRIRLERVLAQLKNSARHLEQAAAIAQTEQKLRIKAGHTGFSVATRCPEKNHYGSHTVTALRCTSPSGGSANRLRDQNDQSFKGIHHSGKSAR
jgi:hypothetical protein